MSIYDDIMHVDRPISKKHKPMSMANRAAQFSPFAALTGYEEIIDEVGRQTSEKIILNEDQKAQINDMLVFLNSHKDISVNVTYFVKDSYKKGGAYENIVGNIKKIDLDNHQIIFEDKQNINIEDIVSLEI